MTEILPRKDLFDLPEGIVYLNGNSLGPLPKAVTSRVTQTITDEWGKELIRAWNSAGWMDQPTRIGNQIARLIGAQPGSVVPGDTLSIKVFQALAAALDLVPERRVILSDTGNFPSDLYMAEGLIRLKDAGYELRLVAPEDVEGAIDDTVAALLLTEVDYRTGRRHPMARTTEKAHSAGAVMIWDLAHSAGAIEVDLAGSGCEFAVGCTYKYLNAGPGSPAFIYTRPDLAAKIRPALSGWLGHDAPFAFETGYRPASGSARLRVGTPAVLQMAALEAALELWRDIDMSALAARAAILGERLIRQIEAACPSVRLVSPRAVQDRGSHVSFAFEHGYATMQALIDQGVIGDFRAPDVMRFGIAPLYVDEEDIDRAVMALRNVIDTRAWEDPRYQVRKAVT